MTTSKAAQKRHFTIDEANRSLPLVAAIVRDLVKLWSDVIERRERLAILLSGRDIERNDVYSQELAVSERAIQRDTDRLEELLKELRDLGIVPGGPSGIIGFPSTMNGEPILLSWKLGEPEILYWHAATAEFDDRKRLPKVSVGEENLILDVNQ